MGTAITKATNNNFRTLINGQYIGTVTAYNESKAGNGVNVQFRVDNGCINIWIYISYATTKESMNEVNKRTLKACKKALKKGTELDLVFTTSGDYDNVSLREDFEAHQQSIKSAG